MTGFHSDPRPVPYGEGEADRIVAYVKERDPQVGLLLELMRVAGLRVSEAAFLRIYDMDLAAMTITLKGAVNHTKGGRPRQITIAQKSACPGCPDGVGKPAPRWARLHVSPFPCLEGSCLGAQGLRGLRD